MKRRQLIITLCFLLLYSSCVSTDEQVKNEPSKPMINWLPINYLECMKQKALPCDCESDSFEFLLLSYDSGDINKISYYYGPRISEDLILTQIGGNEYAFYINEDDTTSEFQFSIQPDTLTFYHHDNSIKYIRSPYPQLDTVTDLDILMGQINMLLAKEYFEKHGVSIDGRIDESSLLHCYTELGYRLNAIGFITNEFFILESKEGEHKTYKWLNHPLVKEFRPNIDTELLFKITVD